MGLRSSPYWAARFYYFMEEFVLGNPTDPNNSFRWDSIILNLPVMESFNSSLPFVIKWDSVEKLIAAAVKAYVDDLRVAAANRDKSWKASRQVASRVGYLGSQDASRKRRLDNGPWADTAFGTEGGEITKTVTPTKWEKGKTYIKELAEELRADPNAEIEFKRLERVRGFLCHLAMTYNVFFAYLKGFHLTLSQHLSKRSDEGWKLSDLEWIGYVEQRYQDNKISDAERDKLLEDLPGASLDNPKFVKPVARFYSCLKALESLFEPDLPPIVPMRSKSVYLIAYGFCDASGTGFGSTIAKDNDINYRMGVWGKGDEGESSNWKEFENLVCALEE